MTPPVAVKICGITRLADALAAVEYGAAAVGFNFWPSSARFCDHGTAARIIAELPGTVWTVGVFVDETPAKVNGIARDLGLRAVQLHGDESALDCAASSVPVIKTVAVSGPVDAAGLADFDVAAFLFDASTPGRGGGGVAFDWSWATGLRLPAPLVLAGGLTPANVAAAITVVSPAAVDVASGVESSPGIKDHEAIAAFIAAARGATWRAE
jgi:phosphoribosylanthranilate isomerase